MTIDVKDYAIVKIGDKPLLKEHKYRQMVDALLQTSNVYGETQQHRARISETLSLFVRHPTPDDKAAPTTGLKIITEEAYDALVKDAARYRWLQNKSHGQFEHPIVVSQTMREQGLLYLGPLISRTLDDSIDAAITTATQEAT